jgi:hypothetical protein
VRLPDTLQLTMSEGQQPPELAMITLIVIAFVALGLAMSVRGQSRRAQLEAGTFAGLADELLALDMAAKNRSVTGNVVWVDFRLAA